MRKRRSKPQRGLSIKPLYTIGDLADATGIDRFSVRRLLEKNGVEWVRSGRSLLIPISELKEKLRNVWDSIVECEKLRGSE